MAAPPLPASLSRGQEAKPLGPRARAPPIPPHSPTHTPTHHPSSHHHHHHTGLVYKHYGREIVASAMGLPADSAEVEAVYLAVYKNFMEAIDAIDNGQSVRWPSGCSAAVAPQLCARGGAASLSPAAVRSPCQPPALLELGGTLNPRGRQPAAKSGASPWGCLVHASSCWAAAACPRQPLLAHPPAPQPSTSAGTGTNISPLACPCRRQPMGLRGPAQVREQHAPVGACGAAQPRLEPGLLRCEEPLRGVPRQEPAGGWAWRAGRRARRRCGGHASGGGRPCQPRPTRASRHRVRRPWLQRRRRCGSSERPWS